MVFQVVEVQTGKVLGQILLLLGQLVKKLLGMRPCLSGRTGPNVFLDLFPFFAEQLESLKESEMLVLCPATGLKTTRIHRL